MVSKIGRSASTAALEELLNEINSTLDDFSARPAIKATDTSISGDTPLHKVSLWGDIQAARILLAHGALVNAAGEDGDVPLHRAVSGRQAKMVEFLLTQGADPECANRFGTTPKVSAEFCDDADVIKAMHSYTS